MLSNAVLFIIGIFIGSFLNVCIYRMPRSKSIIRPGSRCVHCGHPIKWYENIPLVSFLVLMGKCSACKKAISPRYFTVELLTGALFVLVYTKFGWGRDLVFYLILVCGLIVATFIDFEHQLIPDSVSLGGLAIGLVFGLLRGAFVNSLLGAIVGGFSIYAIGVIGKMIFKKEAMGFGDVKFLAMIGSFLGWQNVLFVFFLAPFFGASIGIVLKIRHKIETIPYGPYLSLATVIVMLWGEEILSRLFYF